VAETGVARPHGSFRDLIRSKARRKGKKQVENTQGAWKISSSSFTGNLDTDSERSSTTTPTTPTPSGFVTPKTPPKTPQANLCHILENGLIDPLYTLPISETGGTQFWIHHCEFWGVQPSRQPFSMVAFGSTRIHFNRDLVAFISPLLTWLI
jgi:hypothetical protein